MVQKVLLTVHALLWTMPLFMAKHNTKAKYIIMQKVNYKEDEIITKPLSCTELICNEYQTIRMVQLISLDQSKILAYNIDDKRKMR